MAEAARKAAQGGCCQEGEKNDVYAFHKLRSLIQIFQIKKSYF